MLIELKGAILRQREMAAWPARTGGQLTSKEGFIIYTFCYGRIGEIRPLILLGLGRPFLEGFCHSRYLLVDVVDDAALLLEYPV